MESKCVGVHVTIVLNKCAFVGFCLLLCLLKILGIILLCAISKSGIFRMKEAF
jgi:hypothetical protein